MRRCLYTALTMIAVLALATCAMPEAPKRTALVYGISRYNVNIPTTLRPNLTWTDDDAISVADMLTTQGWAVKTGIANSDLDADNTVASRQAIEADIKNLAGSTGQVLFYYSGHGSTRYTASGTLESCIIPYGTVNNSSLWISEKELVSMFDNAGLTDVIIILDSCFSGGFVDAGATVDGIPLRYGYYYDEDKKSYDFYGDIDYTWFVDSIGDAVSGYMSYEADSRHVVISAAGSEESWEDKSIGHGIFTYFLLLAGGDGRVKADIDGDGYINTTELYAYCAAGVQSYNNTIESGEEDFYESLYFSGYWDDYLPHVSGTAREYALWATN